MNIDQAVPSEAARPVMSGPQTALPHPPPYPPADWLLDPPSSCWLAFESPVLLQGRALLGGKQRLWLPAWCCTLSSHLARKSICHLFVVLLRAFAQHRNRTLFYHLTVVQTKISEIFLVFGNRWVLSDLLMLYGILYLFHLALFSLLVACFGCVHLVMGIG